MSLSRSEEMHRLTENVYKTIMEQFNPSLRNFIAMGKNYEKALAGVTYAAKGYFDALVKMGELASESQGSKELDCKNTSFLKNKNQPESLKISMRGWFPFSYTRVLDSDGSDRLHMSLQQGKSSSTGNLLDKDDLALPPPDYGTSSRAFPTQTASTFKQRPYSVAVPAFSQGLDDYGARAVSRNPFTSVHLRPTVTNDRSAPLLS
ncbi:hypothetical protein mRhiFer1_009001 [Rhinolophus ferrumequinum]|uniref:IMD domain-containing protein n=1 Tax=Rhinolophus ferrumequinum TaxID=59479 RepID=A0A7J7TDZ8_RHIFE|nr:hypothetical protein mRhiFer1_009001 [Rhinolophus ferrumequinum]